MEAQPGPNKISLARGKFLQIGILFRGNGFEKFFQKIDEFVGDEPGVRTGGRLPLGYGGAVFQYRPVVAVNAVRIKEAKGPGEIAAIVNKKTPRIVGSFRVR